MKILISALARLFYRCQISMLETEQKTIDRVLREADTRLMSMRLRLRRSDLLINLSHAKTKYRLLAKPFEVETKMA